MTLAFSNMDIVVKYTGIFTRNIEGETRIYNQLVSSIVVSTNRYACKEYLLCMRVA